MWASLSKTKDFFLDLLFPVVCLGCGREGKFLCTPCQQKITPPVSRCIYCGKNSAFGKTHPECSNTQNHLTGLMVAADYHNQAIQSLIWNLKYNSIPKIAETLALVLTDYIIETDLADYFSTATVIPVPLHKRRQKVRGFNQAELIAKNFAKNLGLPYMPAVRKIAPTKAQAKLTRKERQDNVLGAFSAPAKPSLAEQKIILVDDVASTGATLNECARVLIKNQPAEIWGLVVARN